jgi:hypothetical protein
MTMSGTRHSLRFCLIGVLALLLLPATPARSEEAPLLSHSYTYAETAAFRLTFVDEPVSEQATLLLQINGVATNSETVKIEATSASVTRDLSRAPFPPFSEVTYWWAFETTNGNWRETQKQSFRYIDNRYTWRRLASDTIRVHWIDGEAEVLAQALEVAAETVDTISAALQAPVGDEVDIFIYPSETDLDLALQLGGQTWVSGVAYPQFGVVLVTVPPDVSALSAIQRNIPHELTHQALYNLLGPQGYAALPTWLNEGLATFFESSPDPAYARAIDEAREANELIRLTTLCAPFPDDPKQARLAYAQSASLVQYIRREYGWSRIRDLLGAYADGQACGTGTQQALGVGLDQLEQDWHRWLRQGDEPAASARANVSPLLLDIGPWIIILAALCLAPLLTLAVGRRR